MGTQVLKQSVGLDVSKDSLSACFSQMDDQCTFRILSNRVFSSNASGFKQMQAWIERHRSKAPVKLHMLMESTGVYYEQAAWFLSQQGYRVSVLLPNKSSAYAKSLAHKSKTDKIDAQILAQMSLERELPAWNPPHAAMLNIKRLCRERLELLEKKVAVWNQMHARKHMHEPLKSALKRNKRTVDFLRQLIGQIEAEILQTIKAEPEIRQRLDKVCSIKGVGVITAATIISETNGFALFTNKAQLVSYAGYDVLANESGTSVDKPGRISKKGNTHIRRALYFPALVAVRHVPQLKNLYDRVFDKTKVKMKAYVAVQRKLLVLIYTLYKSNEVFDPNYTNPSKHLSKQIRQGQSPA